MFFKILSVPPVIVTGEIRYNDNPMHKDGMNRRGQFFCLCLWLLVIGLLSGCVPASDASAGVGASAGASTTRQTPPTATTSTQIGGVEYHFPQGTVGPAPTAELPPALIPTPPPRLWVSPALPRAFVAQLTIPEHISPAPDRASASLRIEIPSALAVPKSAASETTGLIASSYWVYALAAPFPTIPDGISWKTLLAAWTGVKPLARAGNQPILMTAETRAVLESYWGPADPAAVEIIDASDLLDTAWASSAWAIIPFEAIEPRWKILRVDEKSPLDKDFNPAASPLAAPVWLDGMVHDAAIVLPNNRDPNKLTTLAMTGVTALARHIGERMESKGVAYPARDIGALLSSADITHISNEVSFYSDCPRPGPERADMRFCSSPKYIELLETAGTDIVELTGNHILDWGAQPFLDTLEMYRKRGWGVYGGGITLDEARQPLLVEHNGNQLAFLGCSPSGPENVWATVSKPGSASCDFDLLKTQAAELRASGYLPVITLQAVETDTYLPAVAQGMPLFRALAGAGAVIVSGSQSHVPQTMTFIDSHDTTSFVHYGLGNLFFDQMKPLSARQQFVDRHVFYNGKYLGVELLTNLLEDYARPRPMTAAERADFLETIFNLSDWSGPLP